MPSAAVVCLSTCEKGTLFHAHCYVDTSGNSKHALGVVEMYADHYQRYSLDAREVSSNPSLTLLRTGFPQVDSQIGQPVI